MTMIQTATKLLPHDVDAEEATIGSLLIGADINLATLTPQDFYAERSRFIFEACLSLIANALRKDSIRNAAGLRQ